MPTNQRLRANYLNGLQYRRKPAVQLDEKQPVAVRQPNPSLALALQHDHLLPERCILRLKPAFDLNGDTRTARTNQSSPITRSAYPIRSPAQRDEVFGTDSGNATPLWRSVLFASRQSHHVAATAKQAFSICCTQVTVILIFCGRRIASIACGVTDQTLPVAPISTERA